MLYYTMLYMFSLILLLIARDNLICSYLLLSIKGENEAFSVLTALSPFYGRYKISFNICFSSQHCLNKRHDTVLENDSIKTDFVTLVQTHPNSQHARKGSNEKKNNTLVFSLTISVRFCYVTLCL